MELGLGLEAGGVFSSSSSRSSLSSSSSSSLSSSSSSRPIENGEEETEEKKVEKEEPVVLIVRQLLLEFQINGGNSWAQCRCHGLKIGEEDVQMVSLGVSNMDASLTGGWAEVTLPPVVMMR